LALGVPGIPDSPPNNTEQQHAAKQQFQPPTSLSPALDRRLGIVKQREACTIGIR
jgi:hypothetical protein